MKEKDFMKKYGNTIQISTYYSIDDNGHVDIDEDCIREEFELKFKKMVKDLDEYLSIKNTRISASGNQND
jgi:hypothetical protein